MLLDAFVIFFSPHRPFTKLLLARGIISASIFSENIGGMKLKFGEEIEHHVIDQQPSLVKRDFQ